MTTSAYEYNYQDCEKIDGRQVNAYIEASLNVENPVELDISTTWGDSKVDLTDAVKAAETVTSLELVPADNPTAIQFNREDGGVDCISGDDLSRIISLTKLKDIDQTTPPVDGDVYVYDGATNTFKTYSLSAITSDLATLLQTIQNLQNTIGTLTTRVENLETNMQNINNRLTPPANTPDDVSVVFGNINLYGDSTGADLKTSGLYTHDTTVDKTNDIFME